MANPLWFQGGARSGNTVMLRHFAHMQAEVFGTACPPKTPVGALIVSSEGACAAYYRDAGARAERNAA